MELHGKNIVACKIANSAGGGAHFTACGALAKFEEATPQHIDLAFEAAEKARDPFRQISPEQRAAFLDRIGEEIEAIGDDLLVAANAETMLPIKERLVGERSRTVNQIRMFASVVRDGSWVDARIDHAIPDRKPPKPDVRRMLIPLGPVAVFAASNFPLAFSVAGGDTASVLAAGCPVVVKAHPAHPATSELVAMAIVKAAQQTGMPDGVFSLLQSTRNDIAIAVVKHPLAKAVSFTGSLRAGRIIFDAGASRPEPIPVYAEMGSTNPVFVLPGALKERAEAIAHGMKASVTVGSGQLCTCPGLTIGIGNTDFTTFSTKLEELIAGAPPMSMLYEGILRSYESGVEKLRMVDAVRTIQTAALPDRAKLEARPTLFATNAHTFQKNSALGEELFGPSTVVVQCDKRADMLQIAENLEGHLTATIHGTEQDLAEYADLVSILEKKVGRILFNGFPTGVEVCASMQHGGPYPATTDSRTTSVGSAAILRFARPMAYQSFPQTALPAELQDANPRGIPRIVDGQWTPGQLG